MHEIGKIKTTLSEGGYVSLIPIATGTPAIIIGIGDNKKQILDIQVEKLLARTPDILEKVGAILSIDGKIKIFTENEVYTTQISMRIDVVPPKIISDKVLTTGEAESWKDKRGCIFLIERVFFPRERASIQTTNIYKPEGVKLAYSKKILKIGRSTKSFRDSIQKAIEADEEVIE